jgi:hypothetical protein
MGEMWEAARAGAIKLGGCVIGPVDRWEDEWHCWACADREWLAEHERREHREGRTGTTAPTTGCSGTPTRTRTGCVARDAGRERPLPSRGLHRPAVALPARRARRRTGVATQRRAHRRGDREATSTHRTRRVPIPTASPRTSCSRSGRFGLGRRPAFTTGSSGSPLLAAMPTDVELHTLDTVAYERTVGKWSPAQGVVNLGSLVRGPSSDALRVRRPPTTGAARRAPSPRRRGARHPDRPAGVATVVAHAHRGPGLIERLERLRTQLDAPDRPAPAHRLAVGAHARAGRRRRRWTEPVARPAGAAVVPLPVGRADSTNGRPPSGSAPIRHWMGKMSWTTNSAGGSRQRPPSRSCPRTVSAGSASTSPPRRRSSSASRQRSRWATATVEPSARADPSRCVQAGTPRTQRVNRPPHPLRRPRAAWPAYAPDEILPGLWQGGTEDDEVVGGRVPADHHGALSGRRPASTSS